MKIWAVGCGLGWTVLKKVWADYEQLLREVFSTFCGQQKKHFATFDFFVIIKLVLTVPIKTPQP